MIREDVKAGSEHDGYWAMNTVKFTCTILRMLQFYFITFYLVTGWNFLVSYLPSCYLRGSQKYRKRLSTIAGIQRWGALAGDRV